MYNGNFTSTLHSNEKKYVFLKRTLVNICSINRKSFNRLKHPFLFIFNGRRKQVDLIDFGIGDFVILVMKVVYDFQTMYKELATRVGEEKILK